MKDASTQTNVANQSSQASQADFPVSEFSEGPTLARKGNGMEAEADIVKEEFGVADSMGTSTRGRYVVHGVADQKENFSTQAFQSMIFSEFSEGPTLVRKGNGIEAEADIVKEEFGVADSIGTSTRGRYVVHGVAAQKENLSTQAFQSMTCSSDKDIQHAPAGVEGLNAEERDAISTSPSSMSEEDTDSDSSGESPLERVLYVLKRRLAGDRECGDDIVQKVEARLAAHWADIQKDTESGLQLDGDVPSDKDLDHVEESGALPIASSSNSAGDSHSAVDQDLDIEQAGGSDAGGKRIDSFHEEPATVRSDEAYVSSLIAQWMENFDVGACADKDLDGMDFSEGPVSPERFLEVEAAETVDQRDYNRAIFEMMNEALLETHAMHKRVRQMTGELHPSKGQLLDEVVRRVMRWISYEGTMDDLLDDDSIWDD
ncbi:hypothetical protein BSKO_02078 [Bryopsis sp. KO-2023]|nr:hypothetical protein BSKO_02078 [Bryopsis sp. KO-2023]